jgi:hypothetical protein
MFSILLVHTLRIAPKPRRTHHHRAGRYLFDGVNARDLHVIILMTLYSYAILSIPSKSQRHPSVGLFSCLEQFCLIFPFNAHVELGHGSHANLKNQLSTRTFPLLLTTTFALQFFFVQPIITARTSCQCLLLHI